MLKIILFSLFSITILTSCVTADIENVINQTMGGTGSLKPSMTEVINGLKQALSKGAEVGAKVASKENGFFKNPLIKIPFPEEAEKVKSALGTVGLSSLTDKVVLSLNRAAEKASDKAAPIFLSAIKNMSIKDAMNILMGSNVTAATDYLKLNTSKALKTAFAPIITQSLSQVGATKYWGDVMSQYNRLLFVKPVDADLNNYVTDKALEGLFSMVAKEEVAIRKNPLERTTDLLKKVFNYAQAK